MAGKSRWWRLLMTRLAGLHVLLLIAGYSLSLLVAVTPFAGANVDESNATASTSKYVLPDIGFEIDAPEGFKLRQGLWYHENLRASLNFAYAKGKNFKTVAAEFTADSLWAAGYKLIDNNEVKVSGTTGLLVHVSHGDGVLKRICWFIVFPDDEGVCQVSAIFPGDGPSGLDQAMRKAMLSVRRTKPASGR